MRGDPLPSRKARVELYLRLMSDLDAGGKHLSDQISEIDLTDPEDARVLMPEQGSDMLAHFGQDHFLDRYQRYKAHIAEWRQQYPKLAAVDLRYEQQVVLQMSHSADDAQTTVNPARQSPRRPSRLGPSPQLRGWLNRRRQRVSRLPPRPSFLRRRPRGLQRTPRRLRRRPRRSLILRGTLRVALCRRPVRPSKRRLSPIRLQRITLSRRRPSRL